MLNKKQEQKQIQQIVSESHGIIDQVHCPHYTDDRTEFFKREKSCDEGAVAAKNKELYFKSQYVSRTIYQGKVTNISCHLLASNKCTSPLNKKEDKICHLSDNP